MGRNSEERAGGETELVEGGETHRWQLVERRRRGRGTEQKGKSTHGHRQQCGDCWGEGNIRGLNGNGNGKKNGNGKW